MGSQPLTVLLVSEDRALLRCLGRFLCISGYEVRQVADRQQVPAALEACEADFLVLDAGPSLSQTLQVLQVEQVHRSARPVYSLLLTPRASLADLREALEAGIDDFLAKPVVYGEVLARLRAGARELEFERRLRDQAGMDPLTGLANRPALELRLQNECAALTGKSPGGACVLLDLDFFHRIHRTHGSAASDALVRAVAERLAALCPDACMLASLGDARFGVLLAGASEGEASAWAERLRADFGQEEIACGQYGFRFTISLGIASFDSGTPCTAEEVIDHAAQSLSAAKSSGGNCVVPHGELGEMAKASADFAAPGRLFERTTARDVMTPFPITLHTGDSTVTAAELLRRSRLPALPVLDDRGRLAGLVTAQNVLGHAMVAERPAASLAKVMTPRVPTYDEDTAFHVLRDLFTRDSGSPIVITCDGRPTGFVTPDMLAALACKLTEESLTPAEPFSLSSEYLVVQDLCPTESPACRAGTE